MRKRKYLIAGVAALALSVAVAGVAQGATTLNGQSLVVTVNSPKQDKKKPGPINSLFVDVITSYSGSGVPVDKHATNTKVYFPKDFVFNATGLPQCDPNAAGFGTSTTDAAKALCPTSQVGGGSAQLVGAVAGVTAVVTAFNGTQPAGQQTILLHSRSTAGTTTVLIGTLKPSNKAGFGTMLDVPVPLLLGGAFAISDFKTTIPKVQLPKTKSASSAKKKKKKPKKFYIMAKCSKKSWLFQADTTYDGGGAPTSASSTATCKQKKAKKKK